MQWYYVANSQRLGPIAQAEFERLVADGTIKHDTLVWREGMREWQPYASVAPAPAAAGGVATDPSGEETQVCAVSGKRYPVREMIQYDGKWISAEHRDEYFQRMREGVNQPGQQGMPGPYGYGGFWRRFCALFIDGIVLGVVNQIIAFIVMAIFGMSYQFGGPKLQPGQAGQFAELGKFLLVMAVLQVISLAIALSYEIGFIRKFDATPGKMAMGMKLLRADGSKLSVGRIVGRYFAKGLSFLILTIGYIMAGVDDEKRALHDRICDTRVVKSRA